MRNNTLTVVEVSQDGKQVRCKICGQSYIGQPDNRTWIKKESLAYHLKSDLHARSIIAQRNRQSLHSAREQSIREEREMEEDLDFVTLASTSAIKLRATELSRASGERLAENIPWDNYDVSMNSFSAGIDCTAAAAEERKRLRKEADEFDIWHGADYLPEEDPNHGELLLDELEQDDVLNEMLRNTSKSFLDLFTALYSYNILVQM